MKKKILIGIIAVVVILAAAIAYLNNRNRTLSPPGSAQLSNGGLSVSISYSRPSVRGRLIFGPKEQGALQPYGAYWRLGANEATEVTFNKDVTFNGNPLKAGTYRLYAVPGQQEFDIIVNTDLGRWGAFEPNHEADILTTKVAVQHAPSVEQFTINLLQAEGGVDISFEWADVKLVLPVRD
jgi:hypothetical protein